LSASAMTKKGVNWLTFLVTYEKNIERTEEIHEKLTNDSLVPTEYTGSLQQLVWSQEFWFTIPPHYLNYVKKILLPNLN
jgi:hypothetical protein